MAIQNETTDGKFSDVAYVSQRLKGLFRDQDNWLSMTYSQREVLEAIAIRLARILVGKEGFADHWDEITEAAVLGKNNSDPEMPRIVTDIAFSAQNGEQ